LRSGDDGIFPVAIWSGATTSGEDGIFPLGVGEPTDEAIPIEPNNPTPIYFTLRGRRPNAEGTDRYHVEFCLFKCSMDNLVALASADEAVGVRFKARALEDIDGDFGGSSEAPYGWIRLGSDGPTPEPEIEPPNYGDDGIFPVIWFNDGSRGDDGIFPVN